MTDRQYEAALGECVECGAVVRSPDMLEMQKGWAQGIMMGIDEGMREYEAKCWNNRAHLEQRERIAERFEEGDWREKLEQCGVSVDD